DSRPALDVLFAGGRGGEISLSTARARHRSHLYRPENARRGDRVPHSDKDFTRFRISGAGWVGSRIARGLTRRRKDYHGRPATGFRPAGGRVDRIYKIFTGFTGRILLIL